MNYHPDDFKSLKQDVEDDGGEHLKSPCLGVQFEMTNQPADFPEPTGERRDTVESSTACRRRARFHVPLMEVDETIDDILNNLGSDHPIFDFEDTLEPETVPLPATVCAVDDAMGLWPRYRDSMHTGRSFQEY